MSKKVAFIHPDLGIGGAERLIVDAAVGLQELKNDVTVYTSYHDPKRCFKETCDGTLKVKVFGNFLPRTIFGFFHILCAILRMCYCTLRVCVLEKNYDVIIIDQVAVCISVVKLYLFILKMIGKTRKTKIIFYCHFPDKLLVINRKKMSLLKKLYRLPFDWIEEKTTAMADTIFVNSKFTRETFKRHFPSIKRTPEVLYPALDTKLFNNPPTKKEMEEPKIMELKKKLEENFSIVSINRFEKKKNIALAVKSFIYMKKSLDPQEFKKCILILAGGYDERLKENREYFKELEDLVHKNQLDSQVLFLKSFSNTEKFVLLNYAKINVYTPENEHFGIVPIEAQFCKLPVVACNSGGPLESVKNGKTGYLVEPKPELFCSSFVKFFLDEKLRIQFGKEGEKNVENNFSLKHFGEQLNKAVQE